MILLDYRPLEDPKLSAAREELYVRLMWRNKPTTEQKRSEGNLIHRSSELHDWLSHPRKSSQYSRVKFVWSRLRQTSHERHDPKASLLLERVRRTSIKLLFLHRAALLRHDDASSSQKSLGLPILYPASAWCISLFGNHYKQ